jgi:hypothetical protein
MREMSPAAVDDLSWVKGLESWRAGEEIHAELKKEPVGVSMML